LNRVVVTGMGAVTACGTGADRLWAAARDGASAARTVEFPENLRQTIKKAAALAPEDVEQAWQGGKPRMQDRVTAIALAAAREAVAQAGLAEADFGAGCGVVVGSGYGGAHTNDLNIRLFGADPLARCDPMSIPKIMTSAAASWVGMEFGATGPTLCISTACASGTQAIGLGMQLIRAGIVERCIAGGTEALIVPAVFRAWEVLRVMTPTLCRPFSRGRDGMMLGEGAAIVVLESETAARQRGATVLAELAGYGTTGDAGDLLRSDPAGPAASMTAALADAGLEPAEIGYVNAHGTGTVANEQAETEALRRVFGPHLADLAVSSTKPVHGHALGAVGAIEFIVAICALRERIAPPTINFLGIDEALGIDPVANVARPFSGDACLSNSFAFGGINASLVARRYAA
jgi:nodulation protein E